MAKNSVNNPAFISPWVSTTEANDIILDLITKNLYTRNQVTKSSYRYTNGRNADEGYICRVVVEGGIHPELELTEKTQRKSPKRDLQNAFNELMSTVKIDNIEFDRGNKCIYIDNKKYVLELREC